MSERGWKPIGTAPKDRMILAYSPSNGVLLVSWYCERWDDGEGRPFENDITHWMPVPDPPR
jgi:hypothetical protein